MTPLAVRSTADDADASARILAAIGTKRAGCRLAAEDIDTLVRDFLAGRTPNYQMASWLATVACQGMSIDETAALTRAYLGGREPVDLRSVGRPVVDKHSTGGVGDTVSLIVVPVVAACGIAVCKMSGRGLGHAGGTLDKLESIAGLRLDLSAGDTIAVLREIGMVITGQSPDLAPGDRATYELRDVTGTVESIPLIAASIMSKKVAVGADGLVLDVKTGSGALLPDEGAAADLARTMVDIAGRFGLRCRAVVTDMSQPLGPAVGNTLEVKQALAVLRGEHVPGLSEVCATVARLMLQSVDPALADAEADGLVQGAIRRGDAHDTFVRWAGAQGGDVRQLVDPELLPAASNRVVVTAGRDGSVQGVDARRIGMAAVRLGAGRLLHGASLDAGAGVIVQRRVGDDVRAGDVLAELHHSVADATPAEELVRAAFTIGDERPVVPPIVRQVY